jgi:hypothetical protein
VRRHRRSWWGPCGAPASWTHATGPWGAEACAGAAMGERSQGTGSGWAVDAPLGRRAAAPSRFPHGLSPRHRHRAPAGGG